MTKIVPPVTQIFNELIANGYLTPVQFMEDMRLPGEFAAVPSITTYGTPDLPLRPGVDTNAKLGQRSKGNFASSGNF